MYLVEVIPITRGVSSKTLSYFTSHDIVPGTIVRVPLRKGTAPALVVTVRDAARSKAQLRSLAYPIRKIDRLKPRRLFLPSFVDAVRDTADYFAGTLGNTLSASIPRAILSQAPSVRMLEDEDKHKGGQEQCILQTSEQERLAQYKTLVREAFARHRSVFLMVPTTHDAARFAQALKRGIEHYTFVLHSSLKKKELLETWQSALAEEHPVLIIATGSFLCLPRADIDTHIVERELSRAYTSLVRPHIDMRILAAFVSKHHGSRIIFAGTLLRTETMHRYREHELSEFAPPRFRFLSGTEQKLIDMRAYKTKNAKHFELLSDEVKACIDGLKENNERLFLFVARRGLAPITLCRDCDNIVSCSRCGAPMILHTSKGGEQYNTFLCHRCGQIREALERCAVCDSWKLQAIGIGSERIEEYVAQYAPGVERYRFDSDAIKTARQGKEVMQSFLAKPGGILIGTEMALPYLTRRIERAAVVSMDALFAFPDFRMHERILDILLTIRARTTNSFIIQTRRNEQEIFNYALKGSLLDFYRSEIAERKMFNYPPFSTLIKITCEDRESALDKNIAEIETSLVHYTPLLLPKYKTSVRGKYQRSILLKIPDKTWPEKTLLALLKNIQPTFSVTVDPTSVL